MRPRRMRLGYIRVAGQSMEPTLAASMRPRRMRLGYHPAVEAITGNAISFKEAEAHAPRIQVKAKLAKLLAMALQ